MPETPPTPESLKARRYFNLNRAKVPREERTTWSTPFVWKNAARTEIVTCGARKVRSYDPETGKQLWELGQAAAGEGGGVGRGGMGGMSRVAASPAAGGELLYVGLGGAGPGGGGTLYAIKPGASGDITLKTGETASAGVAWTRPRAAPGMASALVYRGHVYVVEERGGLLHCYDAKTGEPAYSRERLPGARGFTSSPWAADGKVYFLDDGGQTFVVQAGTEFKLLAKNALGEMCWSTPAAADSSLLLRTSCRPRCSVARDARFALAKESSAEPQAELSRFVQRGHLLSAGRGARP